MRRLVVSMFVSVDGCVNGPGDEFIAPEWSPDMDRWTDAMVERFDTLVYGRRSWQQMAEYWPTAPTGPEASESQRALAVFMNDVRKIVFSRTLTETGWSNSELADGDVAEVLYREKEKPGRDMVVFGGAGMVQSAVATGLVDEYWLLTIPRLFGAGTRLFAGTGAPSALRLLEARTLDTGAVLTRYSVAGRDAGGSTS